jgi:very-short-patch-repair endonuclease
MVDNRKNKTHEEIYGVEQSKYLKNNLSNKLKNKKKPQHSEFMKEWYRTHEHPKGMKNKIPWNKDIKYTEEQKKIISECTKIGMNSEVRNKIRNSKLGKKNLNNSIKMKEWIKINGHPKGMLGKIGWSRGLTKETDLRVKKISDKLIGCKISEETLAKMMKTRSMRPRPYSSKPQLELYGILKKKHPSLQSEYPFSHFLIDMALPEYKLGIEFNGKYWHSIPGAKEKDFAKKQYLEKCGWHIIYFNEDSLKIIKENNL